jgi:hypothetical protein
MLLFVLLLLVVLLPLLCLLQQLLCVQQLLCLLLRPTCTPLSLKVFISCTVAPKAGKMTTSPSLMLP